MERQKRRPTYRNRNRESPIKMVEPEPEYLESELLEIKKIEERLLYYHYCKKYIDGILIRVITDNDIPCRFCGVQPKPL